MAGGPIFDAMGIPVGGGRPSPEEVKAMQQQQIVQLRMNLYASLVPVVTAKLFERKTVEDSVLAESDYEGTLAEQIAAEANEITLAALKLFPGVEFQDK